MGTLQRIEKETDVLIIGGGTAGCYAAVRLAKEKGLRVIIAEKANIKRSGCLAAGVNAINAYINKGYTPEDYVEYAKSDAEGIVRNDLALSAAKRFNKVTKELENFGLVILKDENGEYVARGKRNIKINGENIKPILAEQVEKAENAEIINHLNVTDLITENGAVLGAVGFSVTEDKAYVIKAKAVLIATGGAAGLYRPNNPGFSRHKMWYPPFNTGAGYAMGIRAGAEMTSFEMRFVALRCKDTIAPTGTIAQGVKAPQVNSKGEIYETRYGIKTGERIYGTVKENMLGAGPCYLATKGIGHEKGDSLLRAYLNMAPAQTLKWIESGKRPEEQDVEIEGTEPYVVGGHTASGFWVDTGRETTVKNLYAAGDVCGGFPQKYVTGALAEGEIAAERIIERLQGEEKDTRDDAFFEEQARKITKGYEDALDNSADALYSAEDIEEAMQKVMDTYAGGISVGYGYNEKQLTVAKERIQKLTELAGGLKAGDMHELLFVFEIRERLTVCLSLIAHLLARKETRWHVFGENLDHPEKDENYFKYVNSRLKDGEIEIILRDIVDGTEYRHDTSEVS
ncbi:MAG: adenylyl-sulfate reductase subunit alpha [Lachnospiraceae bacterium]|nr:adenylyl-sulfate reductase subunit alpha [Lachnospiraceae bacterium]